MYSNVRPLRGSRVRLVPAAQRHVEALRRAVPLPISVP